MLRKLLTTVSILILVLTAAGAWSFARYQAFLDRPLVIDEAGYRLEVPPGASLGQISTRLAEEGLVDDPFLLRVHGRLSGKAPRIKAGEYLLAAGTTPRKLLDKLVGGDVIQYSFTIIEGWTFKQLRAAVKAHPALVDTLKDANDEELMARLGLPDMHPEGWFFPETYHFPSGTTDVEFFRRSLRHMQNRLAVEWEQRSEGLPIKTPYQALILASIVERETGVRAERPRIAGVFVRRLQRGMRLQTDPTVIYGMGDAYQGDIRYRDLRTDTPYNTYTRSGLPPTPIAMPSGDAIHAVLHPQEGDELYFVARGDGSHQFSATLAEHNKAVRRYQLEKEQP